MAVRLALSSGRVLTGGLVVAVAAALLTGCGGGGTPTAQPGDTAGAGQPSTTSGEPSATADRSGPAAATGMAGWSTPYDRTTCQDWNTKMSDAQRRSAARSLLADARKDDGGDGAPSSSLAQKFEHDVTQACVGDATSTITDTADAVYQIAHADFAPSG